MCLSKRALRINPCRLGLLLHCSTGNRKTIADHGRRRCRSAHRGSTPGTLVFLRNTLFGDQLSEGLSDRRTREVQQRSIPKPLQRSWPCVRARLGRLSVVHGEKSAFLAPKPKSFEHKHQASFGVGPSSRNHGARDFVLIGRRQVGTTGWRNAPRQRLRAPKSVFRLRDTNLARGLHCSGVRRCWRIREAFSSESGLRPEF